VVPSPPPSDLLIVEGERERESHYDSGGRELMNRNFSSPLSLLSPPFPENK